MGLDRDTQRELAKVADEWRAAHQGEGWDASRSTDGSDYNQHFELVDGDTAELWAKQQRILAKTRK